MVTVCYVLEHIFDSYRTQIALFFEWAALFDHMLVLDSGEGDSVWGCREEPLLPGSGQNTSAEKDHALLRVVLVPNHPLAFDCLTCCLLCKPTVTNCLAVHVGLLLPSCTTGSASESQALASVFTSRNSSTVPSKFLPKSWHSSSWTGSVGGTARHGSWL